MWPREQTRGRGRGREYESASGRGPKVRKEKKRGRLREIKGEGEGVQTASECKQEIEQVSERAVVRNCFRKLPVASHNITQHHTQSHIITHHPTSPTCKFEYCGMSCPSNEMTWIEKDGLGACGCTFQSV